jgi:hypothetical protein
VPTAKEADVRPAHVVTRDILLLLDELRSERSPARRLTCVTLNEAAQLLREMWTEQLRAEIEESQLACRPPFTVLYQRIRFAMAMCGVSGEDLSPHWSPDDDGKEFFRDLWNREFNFRWPFLDTLGFLQSSEPGASSRGFRVVQE